MKLLLTAFAMMLAGLQPAPQGNSGTLSGRVTRPGGTEGIAGVQVTLQGPSPVLQSLGYTPNPALTPDMRAQIDQLLSTAPPGVTAETIANVAARMEAQLLGLPVPAGAAVPGAGTPIPQIFATTDGDGRFTFRSLAPGRYQVRAQRDGYFAPPPPGAAGAPTIATTTATVAAGQESPEVAIHMIRGATVSGRVRDLNGQPVSNLQITAQQWSYREGRPALSQVNSKTTDDRGEFRLFWLPPGEYLIGINPPRPAAAPRPTDAYARTWFPNATDARVAPRVAVAEGAELAGIDIAIRPNDVVSVSGRIASGLIGPNGQPSVPAPNLWLMPRDPAAVIDTLAPNFQNVSPNRNSGQFEIRGVPPGSYDLVATAPDSTGRPVPGRTPVDVSYSNVENVQITIRPGVEVKARILLDGNPVAAAPIASAAVGTLPARQDIASIVVSPTGVTTTSVTGVVTTTGVLPPPPPPPPPPPQSVQIGTGVSASGMRVQLRSRESYAPPFDTAAAANMTTDAAGAVVFPSVPEGLYTVQVSGVPANAYVADIREGGVSVYDNGLRITGQSPGLIEVLIATKGGTIEGSVASASQRPVEAATVVLVPAASRRQNPALYKMVRSIAQGTFRINGIPPGDYKLFAWESVPATAYMNAEFLSPFENLGVPVTITAGASQQFGLTVIPQDAGRR